MTKNFQNPAIVVSEEAAIYLGIRSHNWNDWQINHAKVELRLLDPSTMAWNLPLVFLKAQTFLDDPKMTQVGSTKMQNFRQLTDLSPLSILASQQVLVEKKLDYATMYDLFYNKQAVQVPFQEAEYDTKLRAYETNGLPTTPRAKVKALAELQGMLISLYADYLLSEHDVQIRETVDHLVVRLAKLLALAGFNFPTKEF